MTEKQYQDITLDYEKMWYKLSREMENLQDLSVKVIEPAIIISYMDFIRMEQYLLQRVEQGEKEDKL